MADQKNIAALLPSPQAPLELHPLPLPTPGPNELIIHNHAIAIQPLDAKVHCLGYTLGGPLVYPAILGSSCAGTVYAVGEGLGYDEEEVEEGKEVEGEQKRRFRVGDRVVGDTGGYARQRAGAGEEADRGEGRRWGAWQEYVVVRGDRVAKIGTTPFPLATSLSFPLLTAVSALRAYLHLPLPGQGVPSSKILIWGASGSVGSLAVQYARSVNLTIIATASPHSFSQVKKLGASEMLDYHDPEVVEKLKKLGPYEYLMTASGDAASQQALGEVLQAQGGGRFASSGGGEVELPGNVERVYTAFSQSTHFPENEGFARWWYEEYFPKALGEVEPLKVEIREGGLGALNEITRGMIDGTVRGKVVVDPSETVLPDD